MTRVASSPARGRPCGSGRLGTAHGHPVRLRDPPRPHRTKGHRDRSGAAHRVIGSRTARTSAGPSVRLRRADQAAHHRAAARHDGPGDVPRPAGVPSLWLVVATLVGGTLSAGAANTLNCYLDRDIDAVMHRTSNRPLVTGDDLPARRPCVFGVVARGRVDACGSGCSSTGCRRAVARRDRLLRRAATRCCSSAAPPRTSSGAAWPAACRCSSAGRPSTDSLSWSAVVLFLVIFFWTPPHYWPLSMRFKDDYAAAARADAAGRRAGSSSSPGRSSPTRWAMVADVAGARAGQPDGLGLPRRRGRRRCAVPRRGAPAARAGPRPEPDRGVAQADAAVPLLDHLPHDPLPRASRSTRSCTCRSERWPRPGGWEKVGVHRLAEEQLMPTRTARTAWTGTLQEGSGQVELQQLPRRHVRRVVPQADRGGRRRHDQPRGAHRRRALLLLRDAAAPPSSPRPAAPRSRWR